LVANDAVLAALLDRISALQTQLDQLLMRYTEKHPDVIAVRREMEILALQYGLADGLSAAAAPLSQIPGQVSPGAAVTDAAPAATTVVASTVGSGEPSVQPAVLRGGAISPAKMQLLQANFALVDADRKLQAAQASLKLVEELARTSPEAESGLEQLNRERALIKTNYEELLRRRESAAMRSAADLSSGAEQFRIIVAPTIPDQPSAPDRRTFILLGTLFAVIGGSALAYALGLLRGTFVSAAEAEATLGVPVIARLSSRRGVLTQVSQSADALMLVGAVAGLFAAAFVLSAATQLMSPIRTEIYRLFDGALGSILGLM
jgi:hypothetical protein